MIKLNSPIFIFTLLAIVDQSCKKRVAERVSPSAPKVLNESLDAKDSESTSVKTDSIDPTATEVGATSAPKATGVAEPKKPGSQECVDLQSLKFLAFNAIAFNNATIKASEVEGRLGIGNDASLTDYAVGAALAENKDRFDLVVGNNLNLLRGSTPKGSVSYGGTLDQNAWSVFGTVVKNSSIFNFAAAQNELSDLSRSLSSLPPNGTVVPSAGTVRMERTLEGTSLSVNVFTLTSEQLLLTWGLIIKAPQGSTAIINILGSNPKFSNLSFKTEGIAADRIVYNFTEAQTLPMEIVVVEGSVFAPNAEATFNSGSVLGHFFTKGFTGNGEVSNAPFIGCLPKSNSNGGNNPGQNY